MSEQLLLRKARSKFIRYMANKPDKFGVKFSLAVDIEKKYLFNGFPCIKKQLYACAHRCCAEAYGSAFPTKLQYNVTCDNFFTSFGLALKLVKKKCSLVGTLHRNRKEVPEECKKKRNCMKPKCLGMMAKRQSHSHPTSAKQHKT